MELIHCPECDTLNPPGVSVCQQCHTPLPEIADKPPEARKEETVAAPENGAPTPVPADSGSPAAVEPVPFEGSSEILARVASLRKSIERNPTAKALYLQLSQIYADGGRKDLAVTVLEDLLEVDPKNVYVRHRADQLKRPAVSPAPTMRSSGQTSAYARPAGPVAMYPRRAASSGHSDSLRRLVQRRKGLIIAIAAGFLALGIAGVRFLMPSTRQLVAGDFRAYAAKWSPTGKHFAFLLDQNAKTSLAVYDMRRHSYRVLNSVGGWSGSAFDWSPDGQRLAYVASSNEEDWRDTIWVTDIVSGESRVVGAGSAPVWCADGANLLVVCPIDPIGVFGNLPEEWTPPAPGLCRMSATTGETRRLSTLTEREYIYSPRLEKIAFNRMNWSGDASAVSIDDGAKEFIDFVGSVAEGGARNLAEGSRDLAREVEARRYLQDKKGGQNDDSSASYSTDVFVMDVAGWEPVQITSDGRSSLISWTPDGLRILLSVKGPSGAEVWTVSPNGGDRTAVIAAPLTVAGGSSAALTSDGRYVLFVAPVSAENAMTSEDPADLHVFRVGSSSAKRLENKHPFKQRFSLSPDGKRLVYEVGADVKLLRGAQRSELWLMSR
ncbi:MAG: PD40 domain-containing protein [Vicinamibacteria bacterium]|nr:PD40 domain-containing protein [Vicinamibacteria bacterium]